MLDKKACCERPRYAAVSATPLDTTAAVDAVSADDYDAIFIPGGHGVMWDMPESEALQRLVAAFADAGKIVSSVCHGPAALVNVKLANGSLFVKGKKVRPVDHTGCQARHDFAQGRHTLGDPDRYGPGARVQVTCFSDSEEKAVQTLEVVPWTPEGKMKEIGAEYSAKGDWQPHTLVDGKLITGQNPQSSEGVAQKVIEALG